jgi:formamidopyrimidine-DNA glycosylase
MPQMQALAERVADVIVGHRFAGADVLGFSGLKTAVPPPEVLLDDLVTAVGRRGKFLVVTFASEHRLLVHLSQAGRLDIEDPPKRTKPKGSVVRVRFVDDDGTVIALLVREYGTERKAGWWILAPGDEGRLATLGPEPGSEEFAAIIRAGEDRRRIHTLLRDQHTVAGVGRGYADDALWRARLSPFAALPKLTAEQREALLDAINGVMADGLTAERSRVGGLSAPKLGDHFEVHGHFEEPCPRCGTRLERVSYESHEVTYCPVCQTGGKLLADRRLSRLLK